MTQVTNLEELAVRHPFNGKPFYCVVCGAGFGEYMACEEVDCRLEREEEAALRARSTNGEK